MIDIGNHVVVISPGTYSERVGRVLETATVVDNPINPCKRVRVQFSGVSVGLWFFDGELEKVETPKTFSEGDIVRFRGHNPLYKVERVMGDHMDVTTQNANYRMYYSSVPVNDFVLHFEKPLSIYNPTKAVLVSRPVSFQ